MDLSKIASALEARDVARAAGDYATADRIRDELRAAGVTNFPGSGGARRDPAAPPTAAVLQNRRAKAERKRAARGVCFAFVRGDCARGDKCAFSHDEALAQAKKAKVAAVGEEEEAEEEEEEEENGEDNFSAQPLPLRAGDVIARSFEVSYAAAAGGGSNGGGCRAAFEDQYVYRHHNGVCVVGLANTHPVVADAALVPVRVEFADAPEVQGYGGGGGGGGGGGNGAATATPTSLLDVTVSGKRKRGGAKLHPGSVLCTIHCAVAGGAAAAGTRSFVVRACVSGRLVEANGALLGRPSLLGHAATASTTGHVAILLPSSRMGTLRRLRAGAELLPAAQRATGTGRLVDADEFASLRGTAAIARIGGSRAFGGPTEAAETAAGGGGDRGARKRVRR